jgi:hypothetical protein
MQNNPLRQFFRRPSIYIALPSKGRFYSPEVFTSTENGEIPVYPMSTVDEITSKTPDALYSGQAVVDIIQSCVPNVKNAWELNIIDIEALLIAIRVASNGEEMDLTSTCPACNNEATFGVNLVNLLGTQRDINYEEVLKIRELDIKFRPLTYRETNANNIAQYEMQKITTMWDQMDDSNKSEEINEAVKRLNDLLLEVIVNTVDYIQTPEVRVDNREFIKEFLVNCDKQTSNAIKNKSIDLKSQNDLKPLQFKCINCGHEYQQDLVLNISNFFD